MKQLLTILILATTFSASAGWGDIFRYDKPSPDDSWKKLSSDRQLERVMFLLPQYSLSYGQFSRGHAVCVDGDMIKLKKSIKKCVKRGRGDERHTCLEYKTVRPSTPISGTRYRCVRRDRENHDCLQYADVPFQYETEKMVSVHRHTKSDNGGWSSSSNFGKKLFEKYFALDECN